MARETALWMAFTMMMFVCLLTAVYAALLAVSWVFLRPFQLMLETLATAPL